MCTGAVTVSALIYFMISKIFSLGISCAVLTDTIGMEPPRTQTVLGDDARRMCDFLCGIVRAALAGISGDGDNISAIHGNCDGTAQRAADACKISCFHVLRLLFYFDGNVIQVTHCFQNGLLQLYLLHLAGSHDRTLAADNPLVV